MASTVEHSPTTSQSSTQGLVPLPTHIIWTNDGSNDQSNGGGVDRYFKPKAPPKHASSSTGSVRHRSGSGASETSTSVGHDGMDSAQRVFRLERSLRFLKTQHQKMLSDLHTEVGRLQIRNRELQFQSVVGEPLAKAEKCIDVSLLVTVGSQTDLKTLAANATTQTEDPLPASATHRLSHLEGELANLRLALDDAENRNSSLSMLVSQLKRSHMKLKSSTTLSQQQRLQHLTPDLTLTPPLYTKKFEEYEESIRRLRRENFEQKKELQQVRASLDSYRNMTKLATSTMHSNNSSNDIDLQKLPRIPLPATASHSNQNRTSVHSPPLPRKFSLEGRAAQVYSRTWSAAAPASGRRHKQQPTGSADTAGQRRRNEDE